jgi:hypothetical protein
MLKPEGIKMKLLLKIIILLIIILTSQPSSASYDCSPTCYVSKLGNDNNNGTIDYPWLTIDYAGSVATAGDTVYIANGTYSEQVTIDNSGSVENYITFISTNKWGAIIDGFGVTLADGIDSNGFGDGLLRIRGLKSYIKIKDFKIINSTSVGIFVLDSGADHVSNIWIEGNNITNTSSSAIIIRTGNNHTVTRNVMSQNVHGVPPSDNSQEIISLQGISGDATSYISDFNISYNNITEGDNPANGGEGIDCKIGCKNGTIHDNIIDGVVSTGIYVDGWNTNSSNISIYNNKVNGTNRRYGTGISVGAEYSGYVSDISIYNNIITNNNYSGIDIPGSNSSETIKNVSICFNTIVNNGLDTTSEFGGISLNVYFSLPILDNVTVCNNILDGNQDFSIANNSANIANLNINNNLIHDYKSWSYSTYNENLGTDSIQSDPQFYDNITNNFTLNLTSPAIDNGTLSFTSIIDYNNDIRPKILTYDIGAYEYQLNMNVYPYDTNLSNFSITPTIFNSTYASYNESSLNSSNTARYTICDRNPSTSHTIKIFWNNGTKFQDFYVKSNNTGCINYNSTGFESPRYTIINQEVLSVTYAILAISATVIISGVAYILKRFKIV